MEDALDLLKALLRADFISEHELTDDDLNAYLSLASNSIKRYKGCTTLDEDEYYVDIARISQLNILKSGAEGQISHEENGVIRTYSHPEIEYEVLKNIPTTLK